MILNISKNKSFFNFIVGVLFLFLIVFPKGGIKINNIPITWGYILFGIISSIALIRKKYIIKKESIYILLSLIPFQIFSLISLCINKIENIGFAISFFSGFFILPFFLFFVLSNYIQHIDIEYFSKIFKRSLLFIASYGIFLFFYKIIFGSLIEIPFLTINYHDKGLMETIKCINRGSFFKLISTYNNGNLYGISMLMFLPLYNYLEKNKIKKSIVKLSLILTLSRTVWAGFIFCEFFYALFIKKNKVSAVIKFLISMTIFALSVCFIIKKMSCNGFWLIDPTLNNRINPQYYNIELLSSVPFMHIEEMLYNSILHIFGFVGLTLFIFGFFSPLFIYLIKLSKNNETTINKTIFLGLSTYAAVSILDSAILYIPILFIYWFLASFLMTSKDMQSN